MQDLVFPFSLNTTFSHSISKGGGEGGHICNCCVCKNNTKIMLRENSMLGSQGSKVQKYQLPVSHLCGHCDKFVGCVILQSFPLGSCLICE